MVVVYPSVPIEGDTVVEEVEEVEEVDEVEEVETEVTMVPVDP